MLQAYRLKVGVSERDAADLNAAPVLDRDKAILLWQPHVLGLALSQQMDRLTELIHRPD